MISEAHSAVWQQTWHTRICLSRANSVCEVHTVNSVKLLKSILFFESEKDHWHQAGRAEDVKRFLKTVQEVRRWLEDSATDSQGRLATRRMYTLKRPFATEIWSGPIELIVWWNTLWSALLFNFRTSDYFLLILDSLLTGCRVEGLPFSAIPGLQTAFLELCSSRYNRPDSANSLSL